MSLQRIKRKEPEEVSSDSSSEKRPRTLESDPDGFAALDVAPWLTASLARLAITRPTPIQRACIPEILTGRDCIGGSRTGSGKTVAFAVPILQKLLADPTAIYAVVLTPTR